MDTICSSCLQYKQIEFCKSSTILSEEKQRKFLVKDCFLVKHKAEGQFVCNLCLKDIRNDKLPKRSQINRFKHATFPNCFIQSLKKHCHFKEPSSALQPDKETYERDFLKLNKLEAYILKLCIPFLRYMIFLHVLKIVY